MRTHSSNVAAKYGLDGLRLKTNIGRVLTEIRKDHADAVRKIIDAKPRTWASTFGTLADADGVAAYRSIECVLPSLVDADKARRAESSDAKVALKNMWDEAYASRSLYAALAEVARSAEARDLDDEDKLFMTRTLHLFERSGAGIASDKKHRTYCEIRKKISELSTKFEAHINEDNSFVLLSDAELEGVDEAFVRSLPRDKDGMRIVSLKRPTTTPVLSRANAETTRRKVAEALGSKCAEKNSLLLKDILKLRADAAAIAGFDSHAEFMLREKMAGDCNTAISFCQSMVRRADSKLAEELERLRSLKSKLSSSSSDDDDDDRKSETAAAVVQGWDLLYLREIVRKNDFDVDTEKLKEFFPLQQSIDRILAIYGDLLGLHIVRDESAPRWHDEVLAFSIFEASGDESFKNGDRVGTFYLDIFPRKGKFAHQMILPLLPAFRDQSAGVCRPAVAYIGNLSRPIDSDKPALLRYDEVRTMFHEFGHAMHAICTNAKRSLCSWAWPMVPWPGGVEQDFLEVPSMMFENWMNEPEVVRRVAGHYTKDPARTISDEVIKRLGEMRNLLHTAMHAKYWAMCLWDLTAHSTSPPYAYRDERNLSHIDLYRAFVMDVAKRPSSIGKDPIADWYHPVIGYDAGYYGYGWSEVYAHDLFAEFRKKGVLNPATGRRLRRTVLAPGATRPGTKMLRDFLGRAPSIDAYCKEYGYDTGDDKTSSSSKT
eukprot:g303.t1